MQSNKYHKIGVISPEGVYYGSDVDLLEVLYEISIPLNHIVDLDWLERNNWIIQIENEILIAPEQQITQEQINFLCDVIGEEFILLDFPNQKKSIFTNRLLELNPCQLIKELTT